jgi:hypothetical protein
MAPRHVDGHGQVAQDIAGIAQTGLDQAGLGVPRRAQIA